MALNPNAISKVLGTAGQSLTAGQSAQIVSLSNDEAQGYDVYLSKIGTGIDPVSNAAYITMRLRRNVSPAVLPAMTSQIGSIGLPQSVDPPQFIGKSCSVDLYGEVSAGAPSATTLAGTLHLILVPAGEALYV